MKLRKTKKIMLEIDGHAKLLEYLGRGVWRDQHDQYYSTSYLRSFTSYKNTKNFEDLKGE